MKTAQQETNYTDLFFDGHEDGSLRSARIIAPIVYDLIHPQSVVDVGCGRGTWLKAFQEIGVGTILGLDGNYVNRERLYIPAECFRAVDLDRSFQLDRKYELAMSLEVAEHLSPKSAAGFVKGLTSAAPVILFSAALPWQGGTNHINEAWPWYWEKLFNAENFLRLDPIQRLIRDDRRVEWWYRQNICLYVHKERVDQDPVLRSEYEYAQEHPVEWVFIDSLRAAAHAALKPPSLWRRVLRRLARRQTAL